MQQYFKMLKLITDYKAIYLFMERMRWQADFKHQQHVADHHVINQSSELPNNITYMREAIAGR